MQILVAATRASVTLCPFTRSVLPIMASGSASSRRLRNRSLMTLTGSEPARSVPGEWRRPAARRDTQRLKVLRRDEMAEDVLAAP